MNINTTYTGHNIDILSTFPSRSIDCIITSPPYFQLRDYGTEHQIWGGDQNCEHSFESVRTYNANSGGGQTSLQKSNKGSFASDYKDRAFYSTFCSKCNAWKGELGLEPTFQLYIDHLLSVFEECKRVLKDEGTMWVNLGDSYSGSGNGSGDVTGGSKYDSSLTDSQKMKNGSKPGRQSLQSKCLLNIPSRFAIAMTDELNLILRNNIIWHKNNCMPSSATDRFTVDFENIMFFTKKKKYYFEQQFEKSVDPESYLGKRPRKLPRMYHDDKKHFNQAGSYDENGIDRRAGKTYPNRNMRTVWNINTSGSKDKHYAMYPEKLLVRMIEAGCPKGGLVLDPFGGSGTTGITAKKLQRNFINIELNPEYSEISERNFENKIGNLF